MECLEAQQGTRSPLVQLIVGPYGSVVVLLCLVECGQDVAVGTRHDVSRSPHAFLHLLSLVPCNGATFKALSVHSLLNDL